MIDKHQLHGTKESKKKIKLVQNIFCIYNKFVMAMIACINF